MGPNISVESGLLLYSQDGENYSVMPGVLSNIVIDNVVNSGETDYTRKLKLFHEPMSFTANIKFPHKKMKRKTFKKWLMSKGVSRDLAEWFCNAVKYYKGKHSYYDLYFAGLFSSNDQQLLNALFNVLFPIYTVKETNENG